MQCYTHVNSLHEKMFLTLIFGAGHSQVTSASSNTSVPDESMSAAPGPLSRPSTSSPSESTKSCDYQASSDSSSQAISPVFRDGIPVSYSLPKCFSSAVIESLEKKSMEPNVRSAFTRELIVHMTSYGVRPSTNFCSAVARKIILKYPFLRDALGSGYVSVSAFVLFIIVNHSHISGILGKTSD